MSTKKKTSDFDISLTDLLEAGVHFGHQARRWNPRMEPYIWQARGGVHVFDLVITAQKLKEACKAARDLVKNGDTIVFVATKRQAQEIVKEEAERCGMPHVVIRWAGGLLTNWKQIKKSIDRMKKLEEQVKDDDFKKKYTKKEIILFEREIARFGRLFGGLKDLTEEPQALFVVDTLAEKTAVKEANMKNIPIFALVDSNSDPDLITYPIPGNDDAVRSIKILVSKFADAVAKGVSLRKGNKEK